MSSDDKLSLLVYNKSLIGFDSLFTAACISAANNYPPYNIINYDNSEYTIEIAIAGFKKEDITVNLTGNQLVIIGKRSQPHPSANKIYMHRGLGFRDFEKSFSLAENIEIQSATIEDGVLTITLNHISPTPTITRQIQIK
jgi:molecular chaperone IbpA